jgi:PKD-like domain/Secretion system C-terminal sorting domain
MFQNKFLLTVIVFLLSSLGINAQVTQSCAGCKQMDVNFTELANYYKEHPMPFKRKMPFEEAEEEGRMEHRHAPASEVRLYKAPAVDTNDVHYHEPLLPVSPAPDDTFMSTFTSGSAIPPDTHGAIDSQYAVTAINTNIHIQDRVGGNVSNIGLDGFWNALLPGGVSAFDPRVHYDPFSKRWILVTDAVNGTGMTNSILLIGVSATNDPTGVWHLYSIPVDATNAAWLDFPNIGFNQKWIVVTGNMFPNVSGGASGAVVYIFDYANLKSGATLVPPIKISKSTSFAIAPAVTMDVSEPNIFCLETWSSNNGQLNLWKISGPVATPTMTHIAYPANPQHWKRNGGSSDIGPQVGITNKIDLGDDRITSVMQRNGKLWTCHTAFLPSSGTITHSAVMWWQIDTLGAPQQLGLITDNATVTPSFYAYGSVAVNSSDDALFGCGTFSLNRHPCAAFALHMHTDPIDSIRPVQIFRHGLGTYYTTFGGAKNRWGDYSGTCIDPRNDQDFWTIQESSVVGASANWDTWWANVQICPKPHEPTLTAAVTSPCAGTTVTYKIYSIVGATGYNWIVTGTGWSGSSTDTSITVTVGSGPGTIVVYATNSCGQGESHTFVVTPAPLPAKPVISVSTPPCTGTTTAVFTATSSGATGYYWQALGTGWSGTSSSTSLSATVGTGMGTIICTPSNACGNGPADTLTITPGTPVCNFSESLHITNTGANVTIAFTGTAPAGSTYTWNFNGGIATPGTGVGPQSVHWTGMGTYTVTLTVDNYGCSDTHSDTVRVKARVDVPDLTADGSNISIVPNPNDGAFNIVFAAPVNKAVSVVISDMQGRTVFTKDYPGAVNNRLPVTTDNLPAGIYAVTIHLDGETITKKITISR